jgi:hypothetical protein
MRYRILWPQFGVQDNKWPRFAIVWPSGLSRRRSFTTSIHEHPRRVVFSASQAVVFRPIGLRLWEVRSVIVFVWVLSIDSLGIRWASSGVALRVQWYSAFGRYAKVKGASRGGEGEQEDIHQPGRRHLPSYLRHSPQSHSGDLRWRAHDRGVGPSSRPDDTPAYPQP